MPVAKNIRCPVCKGTKFVDVASSFSYRMDDLYYLTPWMVEFANRFDRYRPEIVVCTECGTILDLTVMSKVQPARACPDR